MEVTNIGIYVFIVKIVEWMIEYMCYKNDDPRFINY